MYDYLIVGSGLFGATLAHRVHKAGKSCLVIEKRHAPGGNVRCERMHGIDVHVYGPHIFHTSDKEVWDFVNSLVPFDHFINSPLARYKDEVYNLPFNMNTFHQMWGVTTAQQAQEIIASQKDEVKGEPCNLEEQAISLVGRDVYTKLIKEYTEKQWGRDCRDLPPFIIKRLPVRFTYDNNYFNDTYQGIPRGGYNALIDALLEGVEVVTDTDYFQNRQHWDSLARTLVFCGRIDEFFDFRYGKLDYRTVRFEHETLDIPDYQHNAVVNYTSHEVPYTRIIEHKHFAPGAPETGCTVISREYSCEWKDGMEPFYPVNDESNSSLYERYKALADSRKDVIFGGRLAEYRYYDMAPVIRKAMSVEI